MATKKSETRRYVLCLHNDDYPASLIVRRIYVSLPDEEASQRQLVRIIDESGEDYLYPASYFAPVRVPKEAEKVFTTSP